MTQPTEALQQVADAYGVQTAYHDDLGRVMPASADALLAVLQVLGAPLRNPDEAAAALRARKQAVWRRVVEPVHVAWDGHAADVPLRLPARQTPAQLACQLRFEEGAEKTWTVAVPSLPVTDAAEVEGATYRVHRLALPESLPVGYHRLRVEGAGVAGECLLLAAPRRAYASPQPLKTWGGFLPLYAVRSARDWGAGDFEDLENLIGWVQGLGGGLVGTLPLLAAFLDEPCEPSPYSPASRLFWNEFYLAIDRIPELERCPAAKQFLASGAFAAERDALRATELVDYPRLMALKRRVLADLAETFFREPAGRQEAFRRYVADHPRVEDYAAFRAAVERQRKTWWNWPAAARAGKLRPEDYDETVRRYHLYVQWLAHEQLHALDGKARAGGPGLYLDLPLGVNADSYDVWRERASFALGISGGAPPDTFFTKGQDWGFPPLHPENIRADGYRYLRDCLSHHMQFAGMLRIDHLMGLHRLYWVPQGLGAKQGVYVRYAAAELYAIFCLESNRHRTVLVGEDLGTVPDYVRPAMAEHNVHRLYVTQYEAQPEPHRALPAPSPEAVASLNTHDMPTFTAYWQGLDLEDRQKMGILDADSVVQESKRRAAVIASLRLALRQTGWLGQDDDVLSVLRACLQQLATTRVQVVLANLEDLWGATEPQNRPGTWKEQPNWQRKADHPLEAFDALPRFRTTLQALDRACRRDRG